MVSHRYSFISVQSLAYWHHLRVSRFWVAVVARVVQRSDWAISLNRGRMLIVGLSAPMALEARGKVLYFVNVVWVGRYGQSLFQAVADFLSYMSARWLGRVLRRAMAWSQRSPSGVHRSVVGSGSLWCGVCLCGLVYSPIRRARERLRRLVGAFNRGGERFLCLFEQHLNCSDSIGRVPVLLRRFLGPSEAVLRRLAGPSPMCRRW